MATLVLTIAGSTFGPVGAAVGAALGSYIDANFLFPPADLEGPKFDGLKEQRGSEGMPFNFAFGERVRVGAKIVWIGPEALIFDGTNFFNHIMIDVCQGGIDTSFLDEIYADGQLIFKQNPSVVVVSSEVTITDWFIVLRPPTFPNIGNNPPGPEGHTFITLNSPIAGPDLTQFVPGTDVTISGWDQAQVNGAWRVIDVGLDPTAGGTTFLELIMAAENPAPADLGPTPVVSGTQPITFTQTPPQFNLSTFAAVTAYEGGLAQVADPLMETIEGVGKVPARRSRAHIVLTSFNITKFGNRMPNFEVVLRPNPGMTVAQAIDIVMGRVSNLGTTLWDTSAVTGDFDGAALEEPIDSLAVLQIIMMAYRVAAREVDGKLIFFDVIDGPEIAVPQGDLAAYSEGSEQGPRFLEENDVLDSTLPFRVEVEFADIDEKLEPGIARDTITHVLDGSKNIKRVRLPLSMTKVRAACLAKVLMLNAFAERQGRRTSLPTSYKQLSEGDSLVLNIEGDPTKMIVQSLDRGLNGLIEVEGSRIQPHIATIAAADCPVERITNSGEGQVDIPAATLLYLRDLSPLDDTQAITAGIHLGTVRTTNAAAFAGVTVHRRLAPTAEYLPVQFLVNQIAQGLAGAGGLYTGAQAGYWDEGSVVNVKMFGSVVLVSATTDAVLSGANMAFLGSEVIAFRDVALQTDGSYNISGLLRGLRGTEGFVGSHPTGFSETFVPHDALTTPGTAAISFQSVPLSSHGTVVDFKPVAVGVDIADVVAQQHTMAFGTIMPFPVYSVREDRNSSSDLTMTWDRQTRNLHPLFAPVVDPLLEPAESYEIDVLLAGSVVATKITTSRVLSYTSAQQIADGLPGSGAIHFQIYQMSATIGRGKQRDITI